MKETLEIEISLHNTMGRSERAKWETLISRLIEDGEPPEYVAECVKNRKLYDESYENNKLRGAANDAISNMEDAISTLKAALP